ncbi:MAG: hypothetical protein AAGI23_02590 [Bacteroidota bacterium]
MKNISLKLQEQIFEEVELLLQEIPVSRNGYFNEAIAFYNKHKKRILLEEQFKRESEIVRKDSLEVLEEFEQLEDEL